MFNTLITRISPTRRFSAAAIAAQFLTSLTPETRLLLRRLVVEEDEPSVGKPSCHGRALSPFLEENEKLHVERRLMLGHALLPELLTDQADWQTVTVGMEDLPLWLKEAAEWQREAVCQATSRLRVAFQGSLTQRQALFLQLCRLGKAQMASYPDPSQPISSAKVENDMRGKLLKRGYEQRFMGNLGGDASPYLIHFVCDMVDEEMPISFGLKRRDMFDTVVSVQDDLFEYSDWDTEDEDDDH